MMYRNLRYELRDSGWADNRISRSIQVVKAILGVLDRVEEIANGIPPVENSASRFGNPAFRTFYDKVSEVR